MRLAMHINLSPEMERYLQSKVGTGFYSNATEVVRDAIRRMWAEDERQEQLRIAGQPDEAPPGQGAGIPDAAARQKPITRKASGTVRKDKPGKATTKPKGQGAR
jgi:antitoxin ParD1/3/4